MGNAAQDYEQMSKEESRRFRAFLENEYREYYPPPRRRKISLGWKFTATAIVSLAQIILAAFRTSQMFYNAAALSGGGFLFSIAEATSALLAVEGALVVYSSILASKRDKLFRWSFWVQIALTILVSTAAGTTQSLSLIKTGFADVVQQSTLILAFILGVGSTAIAWLGGDILGQQIKEFQEKKEEVDYDYELAMKGYHGRARHYWNGMNESNSESDESFVNLSQSPDSSLNWRRIRPSLTQDDLICIAKMSTPEIMQTYGLEKRTAQHWRQYAKAELTQYQSEGGQ